MLCGKHYDIGDITIECSWEMFKGAFDALYSQQFHIAVGDDVPSSLELVDVDSGKKVNLRSLIPSGGVPLILNFGSCT